MARMKSEKKKTVKEEKSTVSNNSSFNEKVKRTKSPVDINPLASVIPEHENQIDELKKLNEKLLLDIYRFGEAESIIGFGYYELDIQQDVWSCSPVLERILGIDGTYVKNIAGWINLVHPEDRQDVIKYFTSLLSGKEKFRMEYRILRLNDKAERWILETGNFDYDKFENPVKMYGIMHDITDRKLPEILAGETNIKLKQAVEEAGRDLQELKIAEEQANLKIEELKISETELKENRQKLEAISSEAEKLNNKFFTHIENMPLGYIEIDKENVISFWNPKAEEIFGYTKSEAIGKNFLNILVPKNSKKMVESVTEKLRNGTGGSRATIEIITKNGEIIICDWYNTSLFDSDGNIFGWASIVKDITEQNKTLAALRESEQKIRLVLNNVPLGVVYFDSEGNILDCNDNLMVITGDSKEQIKTKNLLKLDNIKLSNEVRTTLKGSSGSYEGKFVSEFSGKVISARIEISPILSEEGKVLGGVGIFEDVSEKKQIERIFFHDVVNTAANLKGLASILYENLDNEEKYKFANLVNQQAEQILAEIKTHRYLLASKSADTKLDLKTHNSLEFLQKLVETFTSAGLPQNISISIINNSKGIEFETDSALLSRVIGNMIKNAIEAAAQNEVITAGCGLEAGMVTFWVHNSSYIPEAIRNQLFLRSVSTKGEGRGLGTFSMRILTEQFLKGKVYFTSTAENGTTFITCYPQSHN